MSELAVDSGWHVVCLGCWMDICVINARNALDDANLALTEIVGSQPERIAPLREDIPLVSPEPASAEEWVLATQRAHLVQRELLLDTVMQNSPVALVLVDVNDRIAYANLASRQILSEGRSLNGLRFSEILLRAPSALRGAALINSIC